MILVVALVLLVVQNYSCQCPERGIFRQSTVCSHVGVLPLEQLLCTDMNCDTQVVVVVVLFDTTPTIGHDPGERNCRNPQVARTCGCLPVLPYRGCVRKQKLVVSAY